MYSIEVKIQFRYGHRLVPPYEGKCNNVHGEAGTAIFIFSSMLLDKNGMVLDFGVIKKQLKEWIDKYIDHAYICHDSDEIGVDLRKKGLKVFTLGENPTAENLAKLFFNQAYVFNKNIVKVGVVESFVDSIAWYERSK